MTPYITENIEIIKEETEGMRHVGTFDYDSAATSAAHSLRPETLTPCAMG